MPLTVRTNGSSSSNIITSDWFNDFLKLLTGQMQDQEVTIKNLLILSAIGGAPTAAPTLALGAGSGLSAGLYVYEYTYANTDGETLPGPTASITTTSSPLDEQVQLSAITVGPLGTTKRNIYRTPVGGGTKFQLVGSINDNTTTTFLDTIPDASLGAFAPVISTFGGSLFIKDSTGATNLQLSSDGYIATNKAGQVFSSGGGTATLFTPFWGTGFKLGALKIVGYSNASNVVFQFPGNMARGMYIVGDMGGVGPSGTWLLDGVTTNTTIISGLAVGGGSASSGQANFHHNSIGTIPRTTNQLRLNSTSGLTVDSALFFVGV